MINEISTHTEENVREATLSSILFSLTGSFAINANLCINLKKKRDYREKLLIRYIKGEVVPVTGILCAHPNFQGLKHL